MEQKNKGNNDSGNKSQSPHVTKKNGNKTRANTSQNKGAQALAKTQSKTGQGLAKTQANTEKSLVKGQKKPAQTQGQHKKKSKTKASSKSLRVIPLGGLDGIGKNMCVFEYGEEMIIVDAGLMFPDDDQPGVDLILPDYSYVLENAHKLKAIFITHGHEDHTGALPYLLKDLSTKPPLIATKLTLGLIEGKLNEHGLKNQNLRQVGDGECIKVGSFSVELIAINHSIPDGVALFIKTPVGNVLHTGDFKFDQTPIDGRGTDYSALTRAQQDGVMLLMSDSTNAESSGITRSEATVGSALGEIFSRAKGKIIVASFSSHIHRLQQVCDEAEKVKRKVVVTGRSMVQNTKIATNLGYLKVNPDNIVDAFDLKNYSPDEIVVLCTGSQGEPLSALSRMATGEHRSFSIFKGDTVVLSATPVPGNEKAVSNVVNMLTKAGANVHEKRNAPVHVSGHAAAEELKLMLNMTKPEYFVPIHGEARQLHAHKELAKSVGIPEDYIFVLENGDVLEFDEQGAVKRDPVSNGIIYVDGLNVGDLDTVILRDRQHLSQDGMVTIVLAINRRKAKIVGDPQIIIKGLSITDESELVRELTERTVKTLERVTREKTNLSGSKRSVRDSASQLIYEKTKQRPMVMPVIIEV